MYFNFEDADWIGCCCDWYVLAEGNTTFDEYPSDENKVIVGTEVVEESEVIYKEVERITKIPYLEKKVVDNPVVNVEETIKSLNYWLIDSPKKWNDFELSWDSEYLYKALFYETFTIKGSVKARKKCILNFKLHPVKYLKAGLIPTGVRKGQLIKNPENREAKPLIKLTGTGDVNFSINSQILRLKGVSGHIIIDCETQSAHWSNKEPQYDKVYSYPFPKLEVGDNLISWDNDKFICEITPRWEAVV